MSITVENLSFSYCTHEVLHDVSFSVGNGQLLSVLGPNGVGKSTLFRCILGLHTKYQGTIQMDGVNAKSLPPRELAHRIAYIPQSHGQTFNYSVMDMVLMGTSHMVSSLSMPRKKEIDAAEAALATLGIEYLAQKNFCHISGGEQQLVLIARALAQQARTLIMDEPTANLDYGNKAQVLGRVRQLADQGYTVLLSTHSPQQALTYADGALALLDGRVAAFGPPNQVLTRELIQNLYHVDVQFVKTENGSVISPVLERETKE